jgi:hypothetical protein
MENRSTTCWLSGVVLGVASGGILQCAAGDPTCPEPGSVAAPNRDPFADEKDPPLVPASKVDLLFVVDDSTSMGDKQRFLSSSLGRLLHRLTEPGDGRAAVRDLHVGVISTSFGSLGGDVCGRNAEEQRRSPAPAHLLNVGPVDAKVVPGAENGFLTFGTGAITDIAVLEKAAAEIILGVGQAGCGFEAQLESMYRFLVQPDPPLAVHADDRGRAVFEGVDGVLLRQRKAFLRPDSAVAVVMITDEDDSNVDPRSLGGQGWLFANDVFPGSKVTRGLTIPATTAPRGTSICATRPAAPECTSCKLDGIARPETKDDPSCRTSGVPGQSGDGFDGFFAPAEDEVNVRFHQMKRRFGVDPQFPIERYVRALTNRKLPDRASEHPEYGPYVHAPTCTNPLFAASLPDGEGEELCRLPEGSRSRELVFFGLIGGVPSQLLAPEPDWTKILGADPASYDETGIDLHMIPSSTPRPGLAPPTAGGNGDDPIHGREWDTLGAELQFACTFPLPTPRTCSDHSPSCDCAAASETGPPLCLNGSNTQIKGKAYPTIRELRVAKDLGHRAAVMSICAPDTQTGYGTLLEALAVRMASALAK